MSLLEGSPLERLELSIVKTMRGYSPEYHHRLCHITAGLGAFALSKLTGVEWSVSAGSFGFHATNGPRPWRLDMEADSEENRFALANGEAVEFHCWNVLSLVPSGTLVTPEMDHQFVIVDFTARYWGRFCREAGIPFERDELLKGPLVGHPFTLGEERKVFYSPVQGLANQLMPLAMTNIREVVAIWHALAGHCGLLDSGFGQSLSEDIHSRLAPGRAAA